MGRDLVRFLDPLVHFLRTFVSWTLGVDLYLMDIITTRTLHRRTLPRERNLRDPHPFTYFHRVRKGTPKTPRSLEVSGLFHLRDYYVRSGMTSILHETLLPDSKATRRDKDPSPLRDEEGLGASGVTILLTRLNLQTTEGTSNLRYYIVRREVKVYRCLNSR